MSNQAVTYDQTNAWERALGYESHVAAADHTQEIIAANLASESYQAQQLAEAEALARAESDMTSEGDPSEPREPREPSTPVNFGTCSVCRREQIGKRHEHVCE